MVKYVSNMQETVLEFSDDDWQALLEIMSDYLLHLQIVGHQAYWYNSLQNTHHYQSESP